MRASAGIQVLHLDSGDNFQDALGSLNEFDEAEMRLLTEIGLMPLSPITNSIKRRKLQRCNTVHGAVSIFYPATTEDSGCMGNRVGTDCSTQPSV